MWEYPLRSVYDITKNYSGKNIFFILLIGTINLLSFFAILVYLALYALKGLLTIGDVSALYNATEQLKSDALSFFSIVPRFIENSLYVDNYLLFLSIDTETKNHRELLVHDIETIRFDNVSYSYTDKMDELALKGVSLAIEDNQKIALVGNNGAGKSTFVNLLTGLYEPAEGNIYINGENYQKINISALRDRFLVVFQDSQIYAATIAGNILMREVTSEEDERNVINALKKVDLYDKVMGLKNGIQSVLTKEFDNEGIVLSGGETQKLIVARVISSDAKLIVLDEVTSNMDAIAEHKIFEQIIQYAADKMVVYISHKLSTTKIANRIYLFENGKITEQGSHTELMKIGGKYREMFLIQAEKFGDSEVKKCEE